MPPNSAAKPSDSGSHTRPDRNSREENASPQKPETSVHPVELPIEPDDAKVTGTSRSLQRRVLGLNVGAGGHAVPHPETTAGQHATGSFTGSTRRKSKS
jgi:hypothetical protein